MFTYTAFENFEILANGSLEKVAVSIKKRLKTNPHGPILVFSDVTGRQIDIDVSGSEKEMLERLKIYASKPATLNTGAGRPKLGVIAREISLQPHHWEWLYNQESGSSATIRRLIDEKIKAGTQTKDKVKAAQEVTYKFLSSIAGDLANYEEAIRYLYRKDKKKFAQLMSGWSKDLSKHALTLSQGAFD